MAKKKPAKKVMTSTEVVWVHTDDGEEIPLGPPPPLDEEPAPKPKKKKKRKKQSSKKRFKKQVKVVYKKRKKEREKCLDVLMEDAYDLLVGWWWD